MIVSDSAWQTSYYPTLVLCNYTARILLAPPETIFLYQNDRSQIDRVIQTNRNPSKMSAFVVIHAAAAAIEQFFDNSVITPLLGARFSPFV